MKRRSMKRANVKNEVKPFKTLAVATIAGLSIIGVGQAQATTLDEVDLSQKPIDTPTLDYLHDNNVLIPQKTFQRDEDGNIVKDANDNPIIQEGTPILAPQSGYSLTKLEANPDGSKPNGDNVITKFEVKDVTRYYDKTTGELVANPISGTEYKVVQEKDIVPQYYNVNTIIPESNNSKVTWTEVTEEGDNTITISSPDGTPKYYKYTYNAPSNYDTTTNSNKTKDLGTITDPTGTYKGGAAINNPAGSTITIENYVFQNNKTTAYFESTTSDYKYVNLFGGAIYNEGEISKITSDFIGNSVSATKSSDDVIDDQFGGAIYNLGKIGDITGDFIGNTASDYGGAIYNLGTIGNITGDFIGNTALFSDGAISNRNGGTIGNITGDFISNEGGAIDNNGIIGNITGDFISNEGGAIDNDGTIGDIVGNFISNDGTAIGNSGTIGNITGNFISNNGEAISNHDTIGDIVGDFISNDNNAIYNSGTISNITGDFIYNEGDAIYNRDKIGNITGDFISNNGRAIYNNGTIGNITGDFISNNGNAIYNESTIGNITGDFIRNQTSGNGGAIYNGYNSTIGDIAGDFIENTASSEDGNDGGAISNRGTIGNITGNFISNRAKALSSYYGMGGAIYNEGTISEITGNFIGNYAESKKGKAQGGAIWSNRDLNIVANNGESIFSGNYVQNGDKKDQQAIFVTNMIEKKDLGYNSEHSNHFYQMEPHKTTLTLNSINNGKIIFNDKITGETTKTPINKYYYEWNQQYVDDDYNNTDTPTEVTLTPELKITGDSSSIVQLNNNIENLDISLSGTNLHLGARDNVLDGNNIDLQSGTLSMVNNQVGVAALNNVTLSGNTNFVADVDLANEQMDRITANTYGTHNGNLNVVGMNLLSDSTKDVTEIYFAQPGLKNNVVNGMPKTGEYNLPSSAQTTFYTPIYKYNAIYDNRDDGGYFIFDRVSAGNNSGNASDNFNPAVLAPSVASQAGANATMNQTFNYAFQNSDNFMTIPYLERVAIKTSNRYALSPTGDATDVGTFSPLFNAKNQTSSAWVKPYASFENIPLKNGPKVSNITYGTLVGFDTPIKSIKHGWDRAWTGYIGYNGASQRFSGVDATQNGGLVGGTLTLYKGNFFNATTVSTGAIVGDNRTMYGTDNYTMLMAGVGNKTGYNFEFKEGKIIIQPSMLLSYTFVNTFDYTNAAGVKIKNDPLHAIQIAPGVKFIANTKNGWQPYIGVNMIWNLLDKSKVSANDVRLPEMSIKPYVQYGVGVQKRFKDRYMAFGQAMIQNGGRNGISLTAGFRWAIGKEGKPLEKVQRVNNKTISSSSSVGTSTNSVGAKSTIAQAQPERKIIKQLSQTQRERIAKQYQNTTRTTSIGEMKKL